METLEFNLQNNNGKITFNYTTTTTENGIDKHFGESGHIFHNCEFYICIKDGKAIVRRSNNG